MNFWNSFKSEPKTSVTRIINNRVFLLGLDKLYRDRMKEHERSELLQSARQVAAALRIAPAKVPVEGYYSEDQKLTEYFQIMRALQEVGEERRSEVVSLAEFKRLFDVTSAPLYGKADSTGKLLPVGRDALSEALLAVPVAEWNVRRLKEIASQKASEKDDFSLVGLASRAKDAVVLAATRESVVLYALVVLGMAPLEDRPKYVWNVDKEINEQASRFIDTFNQLFGEKLPSPEPALAEIYWHAFKNNVILGRCVRLGYNDAVSPVLQYHWAICHQDDSFEVQEFWHTELWTTERYRLALDSRGRCLNL